MKETMEQYLQRVSKIEFTYIFREMVETFFAFTLDFKEEGITSDVEIKGIEEISEKLEFTKELESKIMEYLIKTNLKNWKKEYFAQESEGEIKMSFEWKLVVTFKDDSTKECHGINSSPRKMIHMTMISMAIQAMVMKQAKKGIFAEANDEA